MAWATTGMVGDMAGIVANLLVTFGLLLPSLADGARRLHDTRRRGWWPLVSLVPLVGPILLLVWARTSAERQPNRFGANPPADSLFAGAQPARYRRKSPVFFGPASARGWWGGRARKRPCRLTELRIAGSRSAHTCSVARTEAAGQRQAAKAQVMAAPMPRATRPDGRAAPRPPARPRRG